jgi:hypothetical protein
MVAPVKLLESSCTLLYTASLFKDDAMSKRDAKIISAAMKAAREEISNLAAGGRFAAGMANEGYAGGYLDALNHVQLALNGVPPGGRYSRAWDEAFKANPKRTTGSEPR